METGAAAVHWDELDYEGIGEELSAMGLSTGAAESHGVLCGLLCAHGHVDTRNWIDELLRTEAAADQPAGSAAEPPAEVEELHRETVRRIDDENYDFQLLMPSDARPLAERIDALGRWCQGFLYGFGTGGAERLAALPEPVAEITHDLAEISRVSAATSGSEEDESSYAELVEYIRVGILVIHAELQAPQRDGPVLH